MGGSLTYWMERSARQRNDYFVFFTVVCHPHALDVDGDGWMVFKEEGSDVPQHAHMYGSEAGIGSMEGGSPLSNGGSSYILYMEHHIITCLRYKPRLGRYIHTNIHYTHIY